VLLRFQSYEAEYRIKTNVSEWNYRPAKAKKVLQALKGMVVICSTEPWKRWLSFDALSVEVD
jgi:hypothetical protein